MSQVKKLQGGGTSESEEPKKKLGSITIDGVKYEGTPETLQNLSRYLSGYGDQTTPLAGLTSAIANGQDIVYNTVGNTIEGMNGLWAGVSDRDDEKRGAGTSRWRKRWQATFDTDAHRFRDALKLLSGFRNAGLNPSDTNLSNLKDITGERIYFDYDPETNQYLAQGAGSLSVAKRLELMQDYLRNPKEQSDKVYRLGSEYNPDNLYTLYGTYGTPEAFKAKLDEIIGRAKLGPDKLTPDDKALLKNFNIWDKDDDEKRADAQVEAQNNAEKAKWNDAGFGGLWDSLGGIAVINDDGSISVNPGTDWLLSGFGGNIWFNDDFYRTPQGTDSRFAPYRGLTYLNGKLYAPGNAALNAYLNADGGFNSKMKSGDWSGANSDIQFLFTDEAKKIPGLLGNDVYSEYLSNNPNLRFKNLTGLVTVNGMSPDDQIVEIYDLNDEDYNGFYRTYKPKYALLDNNGKLIRQLDSSELSTLSNGVARGDLLTHKRVHSTGTMYDGMYYEDLADNNGNPTNFRIFRSPKDNTYIIHLPQGLRNGLFGGARMNKNIRLPENLAKVLINNVNWRSKVFESAQNQTDFERILSDLIRRKGIRIGLESSLKKLGFNDLEIDEFKKALAGSMQDRRFNYLVDDVILEKNGGTLKHQFGGIAGGTTSAAGVTEQKVTPKTSNPQNATVIGKGAAKDTWTDADTADIIALTADLASLGLALAPDPYTDIASVATGIGGSTARLYADSQRGTEGRGLNYLTSLGMDLVGLVPIIGGPVKSQSVIGKVRKALPTVLKSLALVGAPIEVSHAARNIANGNFTIRDLNMLVDALGGLEVVRRSGFKSGVKKTKEFQEIEIPGKKGVGELDLSGKKFKFTEEELTPLLDKTPQEQQTALNEMLLAKVKAETKNNNITLEQVLSAVDKKNFNVEALINNPVVGKKSNFDLSGRNIKLSSKEVESIAKLEKTKQSEALDNLIWDKVKVELQNPNISKEQALKLVDRSQFDKTVRNWKIGKGFLQKDLTFDFGAKEVEGAEEAVKSSGNAFKDWWNGTGKFRTLRGEVSRADYRNMGNTPRRVTTTRVYNPKKVTFNNKTYEFTPEEVSIIAKRSNGWENIFKNKLAKTEKKNWTDFFHEYNGIKNTTTVQGDITGNIPEIYRRYLFKQPGLGIKVGPVSSYIRKSPLMYFQRGMLPWMQLTDNEVQPLPGYVMRPLYEKEGGKIAKAQPGLSLTDKAIGNGWTWNPNGTLNRKNTILDPNQFNPKYELLGVTSPTLDVAPTTTTPDVEVDQTEPEIESGNKKERKPRAQGGINSKPFNFDPTVPLNWARALYSMHQSNKQLKNFEKLPTLQMQYPLTNAPRYINSGTGNAYRTSAQKLRLHKTATSDATMDWLTRQQELQKALELERQGDLADSQEYGQYKAALDDYNYKVALRNTDIANKNGELRFNRIAQGIQAKNANIAEKSKFFDQAAYATQDWITRQLNLRDSIKMQKAYNSELGDLSKWYDDQVASINAEFPTDTAKQSDAYRQRMTQLGTMLMLKKNGLGIVGQESILKTPFDYYLYKKGGSIKHSSNGKNSKVTYSRDPYPELLLQNSKNSDEFVKQLNDSVIKLILQTKPLYVS